MTTASCSSFPVSRKKNKSTTEITTNEVSPIWIDDPRDDESNIVLQSLFCSIDFSKPDALRTRALVAEDHCLYVDDYYLGIWSNIFRNWFFGDGVREREKQVTLHGKRYHHVYEFLSCIYPQQKEVTEGNIQVVLPLAYEFQTEELIQKCVKFLKYARLTLMDKIVLGDRYQLDNLLSYCLRQFRLPNQVNFESSQYHALTDRTKVRLLETFHSRQEQFNQPLEPERRNIQPVAAQLARFGQKSELFFGTVKGHSGRNFYCNPYYLAAWSSIVHEQVTALSLIDVSTSLSDDELVHFLLAITPPMIDIDDTNLAPILRAACKLEAIGMVRKCVEHLLFRATTLSMFEKLALLDRCYLHEILEPALRPLTEVHALLMLTLHPTYDTLSTKAKAAILDRIAVTQKQNGLRPHFCQKCQRQVMCSSLKSWLCPQCCRFNGKDAPDRGKQPGKSVAIQTTDQMDTAIRQRRFPAELGSEVLANSTGDINDKILYDRRPALLTQRIIQN